DDGAIRQMFRVLERRMRGVRNIQREDAAFAMLGNEARVEARAGAHFEHVLPVAIECLQFGARLQAELLAVPPEQEILMLRLQSIHLEASPLVRKSLRRLRLTGGGRA